jgi:glycosyltransferase involved in cell wall biosynthesis
VSNFAQCSPLVSVVTPSLNQAAYIEATIRSVAEQSYPRIEHIVVDGGSTDGTLDILRRWPHLRWLSEPDEGQSSAIAKGFAMARGDVFAWLNSDDYYIENAVAIAVETLAAADYGLVYGDVIRVNDDNVNPRRIRARPFDLWWEVNVHNSIYQPAAFFTREAYECVGGVAADLHYAMDYDLWLRMGERFDVLYIERELAVQRVHAGAKTVAQRKRFYGEDRRISRDHGGRFFSPMFARRLAMGNRRFERLFERSFAAAYMVAEGRFDEFGRRLISPIRARLRRDEPRTPSPT